MTMLPSMQLQPHRLAKMLLHESDDQIVELGDSTYSCSLRGAEVGDAEFVRKNCQNIGPLAFTTAAQLKHRCSKYYKYRFLNTETECPR